MARAPRGDGPDRHILLYADGAITPAISVLSAVEGLTVDAPRFEHYVVPITLVILVALFSVQRMGTGWIGRIFGPFMLFWFVMLGLLGLGGIVRRPASWPPSTPTTRWPIS